MVAHFYYLAISVAAVATPCVAIIAHFATVALAVAANALNDTTVVTARPATFPRAVTIAAIARTAIAIVTSLGALEMPLPQTSASTQRSSGAGHTKPSSMVQVGLHPSPPTVVPSSHSCCFLESRCRKHRRGHKPTPPLGTSSRAPKCILRSNHPPLWC